MRSPTGSVGLNCISTMMLVLQLFSVTCFAESEIMASVSSHLSNNARKTSDNKVSERQEQVALQALLNYENSYSSTSIDYSATRYFFEKNSQDEKDIVEGGASIVLGKPTGLLGAELSHSQRALKTTPDGVDLVENIDERQILTAKPYIRARTTKVDTIVISAEQTEIQYRSDTGIDSSRTGASVNWRHSLSNIDDLSLNLNSTEIKFKDMPRNDYSFRSATVAYTARLKKLDYRAEFGVNKMLRDENNLNPLRSESYSSPTYKLDVNYISAGNSFNINGQRLLTDTSIGNGNDPADIGNSDSSNQIFDRYELREVGVAWENSSVCLLCKLGVNVSAKNERYEVLPEDLFAYISKLYFSYSLSPTSDLNLTLTSEDNDYDEGARYEDYKQLTSYLAYTYSPQIGVDLVVFAQQQSRTGGHREYDEGMLGLKVSYMYK